MAYCLSIRRYFKVCFLIEIAFKRIFLTSFIKDCRYTFHFPIFGKRTEFYYEFPVNLQIYSTCHIIQFRCRFRLIFFTKILPYWSWTKIFINRQDLVLCCFYVSINVLILSLQEDLVLLFLIKNRYKFSKIYYWPR